MCVARRLTQAKRTGHLTMRFCSTLTRASIVHTLVCKYQAVFSNLIVPLTTMTDVRKIDLRRDKNVLGMQSLKPQRQAMTPRPLGIRPPTWRRIRRSSHSKVRCNCYLSFNKYPKCHGGNHSTKCAKIQHRDGSSHQDSITRNGSCPRMEVLL